LKLFRDLERAKTGLSYMNTNVEYMNRKKEKRDGEWVKK